MKCTLMVTCAVLLLLSGQASTPVEAQIPGIDSPLINKLLTIIGSDKYLADSVQYFVLKNTWVLELLPKVTSNAELMSFLGSLPSLPSDPGVTALMAVFRKHYGNIGLTDILSKPADVLQVIFLKGVRPFAVEALQTVQNQTLPGVSNETRQVLRLVEAVLQEPAVGEVGNHVLQQLVSGQLDLQNPLPSLLAVAEGILREVNLTSLGVRPAAQKAAHNIVRRAARVTSNDELMQFMSALPSLPQDNVTRELMAVFRKYYGNVGLSDIISKPADVLQLFFLKGINAFAVEAIQVIRNHTLPVSTQTIQILNVVEKVLMDPAVKQIGNMIFDQLVKSFGSGGFPQPLPFLQALVGRILREVNLTSLGISPELQAGLPIAIDRISKILSSPRIGQISSIISSPSLAGVANLTHLLMDLGLRDIINASLPQPLASAVMKIPDLLSNADASETVYNVIARVAGMVAGEMGAAAAPLKTGGASCYSQTMTAVSGLFSSKPWAIQMLDAWGKPRTGVLRGQISFPGSYDQCRRIHATPDPSTGEQVKGQYCRLEIPAPPSLAAAGFTLAAGAPSTVFMWGLCVPDSCSAQDINSTVGAALRGLGLAGVRPVCSAPQDISTDRPALITLGVLLTITAIIIVASVIDGLFLSSSQHAQPHQQHHTSAPNGDVRHYENASFEHETDVPDVKVTRLDDDGNKIVEDSKSSGSNGVHAPNGKANGVHNGDAFADIDHVKSIAKPAELSVPAKLVQAVSIYSNLPKLLSATQSRGSITCLGGLRVLSMCWVVLGHLYVFVPNTSPAIVENMGEMFMSRMPTAEFNMIMAGHFAVDTFFFLSGLLVSYLFYKQMFKVEKNQGETFFLSLPYYYIHRYVRLTPLYLVLMMMSAYLYRYMGDGPYWDYPRNFGAAEICRDSWWRNVAYVNNFFKAEEMCMAWGWYLANDMQFYVIAPLFMGLTLFVPVAGLVLTGLAVAGSVVSVGVILNQSDVRQMAGMGGEDFERVYIKPWCRFAVYGIGLSVGFIIAKYGKKLKIHKGLALLGWVLCSALALVLVFIEQTQKCKGCETWSRDGQIMYSTLHRPLWGVVLAWIVLACHAGVGGVINSILSWRGFIPLGRLTYGAYLLHEIIISIFAHNRRENFYFDPWTETVYFVGFVVITFLTAAVFSLVFEAPIMQLEKVLMSRLRKRKTA